MQNIYLEKLQKLSNDYVFHSHTMGIDEKDEFIFLEDNFDEAKETIYHYMHFFGWITFPLIHKIAMKRGIEYKIPEEIQGKHDDLVSFNKKLLQDKF